MPKSPHDETRELIEKAFWWLLGVASTLFISAATAVVAVLWNMNGSIVTLNERVGTVIEESKSFKVEVKQQISDITGRLRRVEENQTRQEKREP